MKNKRRADLTEELKNNVVRDYLRGDKAIIIQMEYKISPGVMYRILQARKVKLRREDLSIAQRGHKPEEAPAPLSPRPKCRKCGRDYDPGLRKDGQPLRNEPKCWICTGWATDYRQNREVYNNDGSKAMGNEGEPWRPGRKYARGYTKCSSENTFTSAGG